MKTSALMTSVITIHLTERTWKRSPSMSMVSPARGTAGVSTSATRLPVVAQNATFIRDLEGDPWGLGESYFDGQPPASASGRR